jgi:hypothetical protein
MPSWSCRVLDGAVAAVRGWPDWSTELNRDPAASAGMLRHGLADPTRRRACLLVLSVLDPEVTVGVLDQVVGLAAGDRDAVLIRQILGRLPYREVRAGVPPVVDVELDDADDHDFRRFAELLEYLGLGEALDVLCVRAEGHPDEGVREVATEFGRSP